MGGCTSLRSCRCVFLSFFANSWRSRADDVDAQGTILYIEELEARLMAFETPLSPSPLASSASPISSTSSLLHPILPKWTGADEVGLPTDTDSAALLLLKFSTSPELRPVFFAD